MTRNALHAARVLRWRARQAWETLDGFRRGYRYGRTFSSQRYPLDPPVSNDLEDYFDAHSTGPGIWKWRHYFEIYERHLAQFRGEEVHLLEVGIYSGGSLGMWRTYLGENARIYGVDVEPACRVHENDSIRVLIGDQADRDFWKHFKQEVPRLDVVIDDGGHEPFEQIATLESLLPHLGPGGVYICEDIQGRGNTFLSYLDGFARSLYYYGPALEADPDAVQANVLQQQVGSMHSYPFVSVIERRVARLDHLETPKHGTQWAPFIETKRSVRTVARS